MKKQFLLLILLSICSCCFAAYDETLPKKGDPIASGPEQIRENFRAIKDDQIVDAGYLGGASLSSILASISIDLESHISASVASLANKMDSDASNASGPVFPGAFTMTPLSEAPATPTFGMTYCGTDGHAYLYNGSSWKQLDN